MSVVADEGRRSIFVLEEPTPGETVELVGLWQMTRPAAGEVSFSGDAGPPVWRVRLPANLGLARAELATGERRLHASRQAVAKLRGRLPQVAQAAGAHGASDPNERLAIALDTLPADGAPRPSLGELLAGGWNTAAHQLRTTLDVVQRTALNYAFVETSQEDLLLARTTVGWGGDTTTTVMPGIAQELAGLHRRSVRVAVSSRTALLQAVAVAMQLTVAVGVAGPLGVLPVAWRYVSRLM